MKNRNILFGFAVLMTAIVVLAGCGKKFDGSSLVGSVWTGEISADLSGWGAGKVTGKVTGTFTTDTTGTLEGKVTKWEGNWSDSAKKNVQEVIDKVAGNFTYTYDPFEHTGYGYIESARKKFTIDVRSKTLTVDIVNDEVLKLQKAPNVSRKLTGPLTKEEAENLNKQAGIEGWKFVEGAKYEDLVVKKGKITAAKCITPHGTDLISLKDDGKGIWKAAKSIDQNGNVFEQYEAHKEGEGRWRARAAKFTFKDGKVLEQWERDADGNITYLEDGQRVRM